jgi:hypothetical protein
MILDRPFFPIDYHLDHHAGLYRPRELICPDTTPTTTWFTISHHGVVPRLNSDKPTSTDAMTQLVDSISVLNPEIVKVTSDANPT